MTTTLIIALSFTLGFTICSILSWKIHRRHKQAWQDEYRRLMGGIDGAMTMIINDQSSEDLSPGRAYHILSETLFGGDYVLDKSHPATPPDSVLF